MPLSINIGFYASISLAIIGFIILPIVSGFSSEEKKKKIKPFMTMSMVIGGIFSAIFTFIRMVSSSEVTPMPALSPLENIP